MTTGSGGQSVSLWPASAVPAIASNSDAQAVSLGVKFRADVSGFIQGIRFYKGSQNTGVHTVSLWTSSGGLLAQVQVAAGQETASGWQQVSFASPVAITANVTYVASYHTTSGFYSATRSYFTAPYDNAPLHALADGASGGDGVYQYGAAPAFPVNSFQASNYWVDVVFSTTP